MKHYLGIDIGGTAVKLGIVDETGKVLAKAKRASALTATRRPSSPPCAKPPKSF